MLYDLIIINYRNYSKLNLTILINYKSLPKRTADQFSASINNLYFFYVRDKNFIDEKLAFVTCMEKRKKNIKGMFMPLTYQTFYFILIYLYISPYKISYYENSQMFLRIFFYSLFLYTQLKFYES